jgi:hypothetical protein
MVNLKYFILIIKNTADNITNNPKELKITIIVPL